MPNEPTPASKKRTPPDRQNAQGDHEGSAHTPDAFDSMNPARQNAPEGAKPDPTKDK